MNLQRALAKRKKLEKSRNARRGIVINNYDALRFSNSVLAEKSKENKRDFSRPYSEALNGYKLD